MDLPLSLDTITYLIIVVLVALFLIILYEFRLKRILQLPLPNERLLGIGRISLPKLGRPLVEGALTTALHHVQSLFAKVIESADADTKIGLSDLRDTIMKGYLIAQRTGKDKIIYFFDVNPCDEKYAIRQDEHGTPIWFIPTQDSISLGTFDGFEFIGAKVGRENISFTDIDQKVFDLFLGALSFLRLASVNQGKIKQLDDRNKSLEGLLKKEHEEHAETRSKLDRALSALEQKTLSTTGEAKLPSGFMAKVKEWFTWPQLLTAGVAYMLSPLIIQSLASNQGWTIQPPATSYLTALISIAGFFIIPFLKKALGRWL